MKHQSYNEPMNVIISGVESDAYWRIVVDECKMKTVLMSYHYLQKKPEGFLATRLAKYPDVRVFIDSGAHTFLANMDNWVDKPDSFWQEYLENYTNFIRKNKDFIFACADLDIDDLVGTEKVDQWRKEYFEPLEEEGVQVCYIWHSIRGEQGWEDMCRKYSYTGFSMMNDSTATVPKLMKRINVAKKYNTRVHGMALTKTEILVRVPFFSADSTTWLVGQQYGELNWFDGRKMKRMLKKEWQRGLKTKLLKEPFNADWDKLMNGMGGRGDTYELLRLNVIAYRLAEEHIRKRLGTKQYWMTSGGSETSSRTRTRKRLPAKKTKAEKAPIAQKSMLPTMLGFTEDNSSGLPSAEWFDGDCNDWLHYCDVCHIDPDKYNKDEAVTLIHDFYVFIDAPELIEDIEDEDLINYAQDLTEENITDREEAIKELTHIYNQNLLGERNDFGSDNEISQSYTERNKYVQEDEFITIDLSENDIDVQYALPAPQTDDMPEITAYDKELRMLNIEPVRDSKGRFVKGQQKVRKPKNIYSDKYPKLVCDTCYKSGDCPQYKAGYVCAYDRALKKFDTRNLDDIIDAMQSMTNVNLQRMQRAMMFETMDGGMPTPEVTGLIDQNIRLLQKMKELQDHSPKAVLSQRRVVNADGSQEVETQMHMNPNQGGILSQIFGASDNKDKEEDNIVEAEIVKE